MKSEDSPTIIECCLQADQYICQCSVGSFAFCTVILFSVLPIVLCTTLQQWIVGLWNKKTNWQVVSNGCQILSSNSLIIHKAKTKENHKCDGFQHLHKLAKLSPSFFSWSMYLSEKPYQTLTQVFDYISKPLELLLKNLPNLVFQLRFSVFGNVIKHLCKCLIHVYYFKFTQI